ncbi:MAG: response regulator [Rhodocyclaceae bacterium]|nr:response regulator [Rhodocyclaceae bacterium]
MPGPTLLLIEDSDEDVALILSALEKILPRDQVLVVQSGEAALDYLFPSDERPVPEHGVGLRLVLLDLNLPEISGLEVLRRIRSGVGTVLLPVVVLSASVEQRDVRSATQAGANSYVRKSLDHARLGEAIQALVRYWLELNVSPVVPNATQAAMPPRHPWPCPTA